MNQKLLIILTTEIIAMMRVRGYMTPLEIQSELSVELAECTLKKFLDSMCESGVIHAKKSSLLHEYGFTAFGKQCYIN